jgi:hypothetical protein
MMTTHATMMLVEENTQLYVEQASSDNFIPLAIKMYGCFHFRFDSFFIACAHTIIACHQRSSLVPLMLVSYYQQRMSIALQHAQTIMIFQHAWSRFLISFMHHS